MAAGGSPISRSGGGIWSRVKNTVPGSSSLVVDIVPVATFAALKYVVTKYNTTNSKTKILEINIIKESASSVKDSVHGKLSSSSFNTEIDASISGSNFELTITNNETFDIDIEMGKLRLGKP